LRKSYILTLSDACDKIKDNDEDRTCPQNNTETEAKNHDHLTPEDVEQISHFQTIIDNEIEKNKDKICSDTEIFQIILDALFGVENNVCPSEKTYNYLRNNFGRMCECSEYMVNARKTYIEKLNIMYDNYRKSEEG
jgi:archaellum component FlaC